jgi:putative transposase
VLLRLRLCRVPFTPTKAELGGQNEYRRYRLDLLRTFLLGRAALAAENVALRQQLIVLQRSVKRTRLRSRDRVFWVWLSKLWRDWSSCLLIVKPSTVIRWHRQRFRVYWRWKSRNQIEGRPKIDAGIRSLIRRLSRENPIWGAPRIQSELRLLGYTVAESTVARYMCRHRRPPSETWRTFLKNHIGEIATIDFFVVATVRFQLLYCFLVLRHDRRRVVHFNVTPHPTARWTAQQVVEAFPCDEAPRFLIRDRDGIYGECFRERIKRMGIEEVVIACRSPCQSPFVERVIGSIRRECLDHVIVFNKAHLIRLLTSYFEYYHESRTHLSLDRNAPDPRQVEPVEKAKVVAIPQVGGLHHRYTRAA